MSNIVERLRSSQPLVICPYDSKSPEYWTTPNDTPCKFCGGLPDGPDKCTGADTRIMGEAADEITRLRTALSEAEAALDEREIASGLTSDGNLWRFWADKAKGLAVKLSEAQQRARREALEEAAKTIEEGFDRGIASKRDLCAHKKFEWEDCESCAANAVRALIPSEPHDAEGRETPRRGDPSIFDDAEGRN